MEYLKILLPVLWVIVATGVGIALYRTSDAFFEWLEKDKEKKQQLKLTGSIVIAGVAFFGLYYVTPKGVLDPTPAGQQYVSTIEIQRLADRARELQDKMVELGACLSISAAKDCIGQLQSAQSAAAAVEQQSRKATNKSAQK